MNDRIIDILVAGFDGWEQCLPKACGSFPAPEIAFMRHGHYYGGMAIPRYTKDLNAINALIKSKSCNLEFRIAFGEELSDYLKIFSDSEDSLYALYDKVTKIASVSAKDLCDVFLKTMVKALN